MFREIKFQWVYTISYIGLYLTVTSIAVIYLPFIISFPILFFCIWLLNEGYFEKVLNPQAWHDHQSLLKLVKAGLPKPIVHDDARCVWRVHTLFIIWADDDFHYIVDGRYHVPYDKAYGSRRLNNKIRERLRAEIAKIT